MKLSLQSIKSMILSSFKETFSAETFSLIKAQQMNTDSQTEILEIEQEYPCKGIIRQVMNNEIIGESATRPVFVVTIYNDSLPVEPVTGDKLRGKWDSQSLNLRITSVRIDPARATFTCYCIE